MTTVFPEKFWNIIFQQFSVKTAFSTAGQSFLLLSWSSADRPSANFSLLSHRKENCLAEHQTAVKSKNKPQKRVLLALFGPRQCTMSIELESSSFISGSKAWQILMTSFLTSWFSFSSRPKSLFPTMRVGFQLGNTILMHIADFPAVVDMLSQYCTLLFICTGELQQFLHTFYLFRIVLDCLLSVSNFNTIGTDHLFHCICCLWELWELVQGHVASFVSPLEVWRVSQAEVKSPLPFLHQILGQNNHAYW